MTRTWHNRQKNYLGNMKLPFLDILVFDFMTWKQG